MTEAATPLSDEADGAAEAFAQAMRVVEALLDVGMAPLAVPDSGLYVCAGWPDVDAPDRASLARQVAQEALAEGILTGHPAMPAFSFPPSDVQAIIRYLDSVQSRQKS